MAENNGTLIISEIRPADSADTFPTAFANELLGGHYQVADLTARNAITTDRRLVGMLCYVVSEDKMYRLIGGTDNSNWVEFVIASTYTPDGATLSSCGGIPLGTDLGNTPVSVSSIFNAMLYPYISPAANLSGGNIREFGSSNSLTLNWTATKHTSPITSITVNNIVITPTGNTQSGSQSATATQNVNTNFSMSVSDGTNVANASTSVSWESKRYWGKIASNSSPSDADILALTGASVGSGNELATNYVKSYNGINGAGEYLIFAWPTSFGANPTFTVNGLPNTAFTKIRSNSNFVNANGYSTSYDVWISNTQQNSIINSFSIS